MKVTQIYEVTHNLCNDMLGKPTYLDSNGNSYYTDADGIQRPYESQPAGGSTSWFVAPDLSNVVDIGRRLTAAASEIGENGFAKLYTSLINHIGKVVFVSRMYRPVVPSLERDNWEYGSVVEKIDCDMPDEEPNPTWTPEDGKTYNQDVFRGAKNVRVKFFNKAITFQVPMSFTDEQLKQSFSSANQLNSFYSMIATKIQNKLTSDFANLTRSTIASLISATIYRDFNTIHKAATGEYDWEDSDAPTLTAKANRAINLLAKYYAEVPTAPFNEDGTTALTAANCIYDPEFIRFAVHTMSLYSDRMRDMSVLFNIGGKQRFTPKDLQHFVLLTDFSKAVGAYLQSDTFHDEYVALPKHETINFWQGTGDAYNYTSSSRVKNKQFVTTDGENLVTDLSGNPVAVLSDVPYVLGVIFDNDAMGINNEKQKTTAHYNGLADFNNYWYKAFARYYNDYDENCVVFFVSDLPWYGSETEGS